MVPTRCQLLQSILLGTGVTALEVLDLDNETKRVFVHPRSDALTDVVDIVTSIGGEVIFEYDNFEFIAADIPSDRLSGLLDATGIALIEGDSLIGIPDGWDPSLLNILDPRDDLDCTAHPAQEPNWGWERIGASEVEYTGAGVNVGILDTGIRTDHCALEVADGRNFTNPLLPNDYEDRHGHGTHVAGIVGARNDGIGVIGVAPEVDLHAVKVLDDRGAGRYTTLVAGIDWCLTKDIEIISMSLGGATASESVDQAIEAAVADGHLLLCAAGNEEHTQDGACAEETMTYPATHPEVIACTALEPDETLAEYSSVGSTVDLIAPGTDIRSTYVRGGYAGASGTSMACPFVSGVAALLSEIIDTNDVKPNEVIRERLTESGESVLGTCAEGHGIVNAPAAVLEATNREDAPTGEQGERRDGPIGDPIERSPVEVSNQETILAVSGGLAAAGLAGYAIKRRLSDRDS